MARVIQISDTHLVAEAARAAAREPRGPDRREPDPDAPTPDPPTRYGLDPAVPDPDFPDPDAAVARAVAACADRRVDLVVLSGDLADDGSVAALLRLRAQLSGLDARILAIAGNHDDPRAVDEVFGEASPVELGVWRVVPVATWLADAESGAVDPVAVLAMIDELDVRPTMIVMHHPPASPSTHPVFSLAGAEALLAGFARRPHVRLVATGHLHQAFTRVVGGLAVVGAPSTLRAVAHSGDTWRAAPRDPIGARVWDLGDDGSWSHELVTTN